jgi:DNA topoisomerase I
VTDAGARVTSRRVLDRIVALRVPPAYTDVHIAVDPRASIQAWGFDARGRRQYRYHVRAVARSELRKYYRVTRLARDLPTIRGAVTRDFDRHGLSRTKVAAGVVRLIAEGHLRIGSDRYARENHTYGTTTLHKRHARVNGGRVVLEYPGKRGILQRQTILDPKLSAFIRLLQRTPGRRLFRYQESGEWHDLTASGVNRYLRELCGVLYTAKDFRTWGGTLHTAMILADVGPAATTREAKRNVLMAIRIVAAGLGNTPAVCRKSYVHPIVPGLYVDRGLTISDRGRVRSGGPTRRSPSLPAPDPWVPFSPDERALTHFLIEHFPDRRRKARNGSPRPPR